MSYPFAWDDAIESTIENYVLALLALVVGVFVLKRSTPGAAWAALPVTLSMLWFMVGREVWLHYFELPRLYPGYGGKNAYFPGTLWMLSPRFIWHLILPVAAVLSATNLLRSTQKVKP